MQGKTTGKQFFQATTMEKICKMSEKEKVQNKKNRFQLIQKNDGLILKVRMIYDLDSKYI